MFVYGSLSLFCYALLRVHSLFTRMDRASQHALEIDAKDKHHAQGLDDRMQSLRNGSADIGFYQGIESIDNTLETLNIIHSLNF